MKKQIILIIALLSIAFSSFAGTKEDLAKEIMQLSGMQKNIDQMVVQIQQLQDAQLKLLSIPKDEQDKLIEFRNKLMKKIFDSMSWDRMAPEYIKLYSEVYTEEELKAIIEFYKSPAGQSMLRKQPIVMQKAMILANEQVQKVMPEIKKMIQEFAQSLEVDKKRKPEAERSEAAGEKK